MDKDYLFAPREARKEMKEVANGEFGGERALFAVENVRLTDCIFHAGESALKRTANIEAVRCRFEGTIPDAQETLWSCRGVKLRDVEVKNADYLLQHSADIDIDRYRQQGNYSFQYCNNVVIRNAVIDSKDAFWETDNVTIYDSELTGEYLGWHSKNLRLVRCKINGTQPLCYCRNLKVEDCEFGPECDLAFEDSDVEATVSTAIVSVKNPRSGTIKALAIGETIKDANILAPADCKIETKL